MNKITELRCDYLDPEMNVLVVDAFFDEVGDEDEGEGKSVAHICAATRRVVWIDRELFGDDLQRVKSFINEVIEDDNSFEKNHTFVVVRGGEVREVFRPYPVMGGIVVIDLDDKRLERINLFKSAISSEDFSKVAEWVIIPESLHKEQMIDLLEELITPKTF